MKINSIFKYSFNIYRFILIASIPLFIIAGLLVGFAGHNSDPDNTNFLFYTFIIITPILLTVFNRVDSTKIRLKKALRYSLAILVLISVVFEIKSLIEMIQSSRLKIEETIAISVLIAFTIISLIVAYGLFSDKINK